MIREPADYVATQIRPSGENPLASLLPKTRDGSLKR
jgi:hypothetical protein